MAAGALCSLSRRRSRSVLSMRVVAAPEPRRLPLRAEGGFSLVSSPAWRSLRNDLRCSYDPRLPRRSNAFFTEPVRSSIFLASPTDGRLVLGPMTTLAIASRRRLVPLSGTMTFSSASVFLKCIDILRQTMKVSRQQPSSAKATTPRMVHVIDSATSASLRAVPL